MKKVFKCFALAAASLAALASCNKAQEINVPEDVVLTFTSEKPALLDAETRTVYNPESGSIDWSAGDKIKVAVTVNGTWMAAEGAPEEGKSAKFYVSDELAEGGQTGVFNVSDRFKLTTAGTYKFYGLYPAGLSGSNDIAWAPSVSIKIPETQTPPVGSFDSSADVLYAVSDDYQGIPENRNVDLTWTRAVAHGDITLKKLPEFAAGETVQSIEFSVQEGGDLVGPHYIDLTTGAVSLPNNGTAVNTMTVDPKSIAVNTTDNTLEFWISTLPFTATSIKVVLTTNKKVYTKEYTGISKEFKANYRNLLGISMKGAAEEAIVQPDQVIPNGDYVIAYTGGDFRVMMLSDNFISSTGSEDKNARAYDDLPSITTDGKIHANANAVWTITYKENGQYAIKSVETGLFLKGVANATYLTLEDDESLFDVAYNNADDVYEFTVKSGGDKRGIGFNTSSNPKRFAMYKGSTQQPITLTIIPAIATLKCATPSISFDNTTVSITTATPEASVYYTLDGSAPTSSSTLYAGPFEIEETKTVKAIAILDGYADSEVASLECVVAASKTISQVLADGVSDSQYLKSVTIMGFRAGNYIIADATGVMLMYKSGTQAGEVGTVVDVSGETVMYNGVLELKPTSVTEGSGSPVAYGTPVAFDESSLAAYKSSPSTQYVTIKATAPASGYDLAVGTNVLNVYGNIPSEMKGNPCILTGYLFGVVASGSNAGKINLMLTGIELDTTLPSLSVETDELVWEATDTGNKRFTVEALNGSFSITPSSADLEYFSYSVEENLVTVSLKGKVTENKTETLIITHSEDPSMTEEVKLTRKAAGLVEYSLTFSSTTNSESVSGYVNTWTAKCNEFTWILQNWNNNGNQWNYVKAGRKNYASTAYITTQSAIPEEIKKVVITIDAVTASKINSLRLEVSATNDFTGAASYSFNVATGNQSVSITNSAANRFYRIVADCASGSSNGLITVSKVVYSNQ